ncbi:TonB family protein [Pantoea cypripedii]|uniref:Protein TonB n=1 Tax=Pantoea cypripedii TaxID=55209 RepID=A0A1X1ET67_PANCY|nr:TonB family protein [Pantoea cypripedii]MBP2197234.1 TonB family protein [Pantoea cypripedii]ORM93157.1 energy transducer TonB [Pantoea cypripedii]
MRIIIFVFSIVLSTVAFANNIITYPKRAENLRIEGEVNVLYDVNAQGKTENIRIISMQPKYVFNRSVQNQIARWKYPEGHAETDVPLKVIFKAN